MGGIIPEGAHTWRLLGLGVDAPGGCHTWWRPRLRPLLTAGLSRAVGALSELVVMVTVLVASLH